MIKKNKVLLTKHKTNLKVVRGFEGKKLSPIKTITPKLMLKKSKK